MELQAEIIRLRNRYSNINQRTTSTKVSQQETINNQKNVASSIETVPIEPRISVSRQMQKRTERQN